MDGAHAVEGLQRAAHRQRVDSGRGRVHQDAGAVAQQPQGGDQQEDGNRHRKQRIDQRPPGEPGRADRDDRDHRAGEVADHVQQRAAGVQVLALAVEQPQHHQVDDQAGRGHRQRERRVDRGRAGQPVDRLGDDEPEQRQVDQPVGERGERLRALVAEGLARVRPAPRDALGDPRQRQREGVGEHVDAVGGQCERAAGPARHDLEHAEAEDDDQGPAQRLRRRGGARVRVRRVAVPVREEGAVRPVVVPGAPLHVSWRTGRTMASRTCGGSGLDFCRGKSTQTTLAAPSA